MNRIRKEKTRTWWHPQKPTCTLTINSDSCEYMHECKWCVFKGTQHDIFIPTAVSRSGYKKKQKLWGVHVYAHVWRSMFMYMCEGVCISEFKAIQSHPWRLIMRTISGVSCGNEFCGCNEAVLPHAACIATACIRTAISSMDAGSNCRRKCLQLQCHRRHRRRIGCKRVFMQNSPRHKHAQRHIFLYTYTYVLNI